jgi:hypothetical protein
VLTHACAIGTPSGPVTVPAIVPVLAALGDDEDAAAPAPSGAPMPNAMAAMAAMTVTARDKRMELPR